MIYAMKSKCSHCGNDINDSLDSWIVNPLFKNQISEDTFIRKITHLSNTYCLECYTNIMHKRISGYIDFVTEEDKRVNFHIPTCVLEDLGWKIYHKELILKSEYLRNGLPTHHAKEIKNTFGPYVKVIYSLEDYSITMYQFVVLIYPSNEIVKAIRSLDKTDLKKRLASITKKIKSQTGDVISLDIDYGTFQKYVLKRNGVDSWLKSWNLLIFEPTFINMMNTFFNDTTLEFVMMDKVISDIEMMYMTGFFNSL